MTTLATLVAVLSFAKEFMALLTELLVLRRQRRAQ
jgi:hypothetical protein